MGSSRPVWRACAAASSRSRARYEPVEPGLLGDRVDPRRARVLDLVDRVAEPGDRAGPPRARAPPRPPRRRRPRRGSAPCPRRHPGRRYPAPSRPAAIAPWSDSGAPGMGEPRGEDGGGEAVIGQRDEHRVEEARLLRRGHAALHDQEGELGQRRLAHQVAREVAAHDGDAVRVGGSDRGLEAHVGSLCFATRPVAVWGSSSSASYWLGTLNAVSRPRRPLAQGVEVRARRRRASRRTP